MNQTIKEKLKLLLYDCPFDSDQRGAIRQNIDRTPDEEIEKIYSDLVSVLNRLGKTCHEIENL